MKSVKKRPKTTNSSLKPVDQGRFPAYLMS